MDGENGQTSGRPESVIQYILSHLLVNGEAEAVTNKAIRGQVKAIALVDMPLVAASLDDVGVNVEVGEEREHDEHVSRQQVLAPRRELTLNVQAVEGVSQCDEKLHL